jgi:hypothetical protein
LRDVSTYVRYGTAAAYGSRVDARDDGEDVATARRDDAVHTTYV